MMVLSRLSALEGAHRPSQMQKQWPVPAPDPKPQTYGKAQMIKNSWAVASQLLNKLGVPTKLSASWMALIMCLCMEP